MKSYIQILGAGTPDGGGPAILLFFDDERYLFNCGEGLQRFCCEHRAKIGKLSHIFLSRLHWSCAGGIPGLISTLADVGASDKLQLVGPKNTKHFVAAMRPFIHRANFAVAIDEVGASVNNEVYQDSKLKIKVLELFDTEMNSSNSTTPDSKRRKSDEVDIAVENLDLQACDHPNHFLLRMFKDPSSYGAKVSEEQLQSQDHYRKVEHCRMTEGSRLPRVTPTHSSLVFVVEGPETPGKFDPVAAKRLGVPSGPLFGRLTKGESIDLPDGSTVTPDMCVGKPTPGSKFIYLGVPTINHAKYLINEQKEELENMLDGNLKLVIHYVPKEVFESDLYQKGLFLKWPKETHHLHISFSKQLSLYSPCLIQEKLGSELGYQTYPIPFGEDSDGSPLLQFDWMKSGKSEIGLDRSKAVELQQQFNALPKRIETPVDSSLLVTILGTGAALPGKYRNVSGTLLSFKDCSVLWDCGEGTVGQILRSHGPALDATIQSIKFVFISHLHADHHAGLVGFLQFREHLGIHQPLTIIGPQRFALWLEEYSDCVPLSEYKFVPCESLLNETLTLGPEDSWIKTVAVEHCPRSFACVMMYDSIKTVFSGDTRPCKALIDAGADADLVIHEATMGDDLQSEAIAKRHCTITEAIDVGRAMNAKHVVLNHFSQRYSKCAPPIPSGSTNVSVTFDLMQMTIETIDSIEGVDYNQRLRVILPEEEEEE